VLKLSSEHVEERGLDYMGDCLGAPSN